MGETYGQNCKSLGNLSWIIEICQLIDFQVTHLFEEKIVKSTKIPKISLWNILLVCEWQYQNVFTIQVPSQYDHFSALEKQEILKQLKDKGGFHQLSWSNNGIYV